MTSIYEIAEQTARNLRKRQRGLEEKLWDVLRDHQFPGKIFYGQYTFVFEYYSKKKFFVSDFYYHESKLIVEIDGKNHDY